MHVCVRQRYALRYLPRVLYLDTYTGYTYVQFSDAEVVTNSFALRGKASGSLRAP